MGQTQIQVIKRPIQKMNIKMKFKKCQRVYKNKPKKQKQKHTHNMIGIMHDT